MSIQIHNDGLAGAAASETSRAEQLARPDGAGKPAAGQGAGSGDRVQISSLAEALTTSQSQRAATVQRLAAAYRNGSYQVDSTSIARALLNESLEAGGTESKP